jgi:hypothetical protein
MKEDLGWKWAVIAALQEFKDGEVIGRSWLEDNFGMEKPDTGTRKDFEKFDLEFLGEMAKFKWCLLSSEGIALETVRGVGYRLVHPKEQADFAMSQFKKTIQKATADASNTLKFTRIGLLSQAEKQEREEALSKIKHFSRSTRKIITPSIEYEEPEKLFCPKKRH